jgi:RNA polymerase sigma-70 factor (ECF subfamily)
MNANLQSTQQTPRTGPARPVVRCFGVGEVRGLTGKIAKGNHEAFDRFYNAYFNRIHRYLLVLAGGKEDRVSDALQDTLIRIVRYMKPFADEEGLWNWVRSVARSAYIDQARKRQRSGAVLSLAVPESAPAAEPARDEEGALKEMLADCLPLLEGEERALIEGKYLKGKSYEILAAEWGLTPKAVESRLARIRKKLKRLILERLHHETSR